MSNKEITSQIESCMQQLFETYGEENTLMALANYTHHEKDKILAHEAKQTKLYKHVESLVASNQSFVMAGPKNSGKKWMIFNINGAEMIRVSETKHFEILFQKIQAGKPTVILIDENIVRHGLWQFVIEQAEKFKVCLAILLDSELTPPNPFTGKMPVITMNRKWIKG